MTVETVVVTTPGRVLVTVVAVAGRVIVTGAPVTVVTTPGAVVTEPGAVVTVTTVSAGNWEVTVVRTPDIVVSIVVTCPGRVTVVGTPGAVLVLVITVPLAVTVVTTGAAVLAASQRAPSIRNTSLTSSNCHLGTARVVLHDITILDGN